MSWMIAGNWKMHKNPAGTASFFDTFLPLAGNSEHCEIVICPPFLDIGNAIKATRGTIIRIGAQDLYWESDGAFTGEVSGPMIKASGCSHVIVGHSERRRYFGETNETVLKKTIAALDAGLTPIVCVGERQEKNVETVLAEQFQGGIARLSNEQFAGIVIGYEPVWAIGDGESATPQVAADAHCLIRAQAEIQFGAEASRMSASYTAAASNPAMQESHGRARDRRIPCWRRRLDPVSFAALVNVG